jgi:hypothetical protein
LKVKSLKVKSLKVKSLKNLTLQFTKQPCINFKTCSEQKKSSEIGLKTCRRSAGFRKLQNSVEL